MREDPHSVIAGKGTNKSDLLRAIQQLGKVNEPPSFWKEIISDPEYSTFHRIQCVFQLFRRHVTDRMNLAELGRLLGDPNWVRDVDIEVVTVLLGEIPVTWVPEDTIFVLRLFPELLPGYAVYLRVKGKVAQRSFIDLLRGKRVPAEASEAPILEVGFSEPPGATSSVK